MIRRLDCLTVKFSLNLFDFFNRGQYNLLLIVQLLPLGVLILSDFLRDFISVLIVKLDLEILLKFGDFFNFFGQSFELLLDVNVGGELQVKSACANCSNTTAFWNLIFAVNNLNALNFTQCSQ